VFRTHLAAGLRRQAREHGWTLTTIVQVAWALVLRQLAGRDDVVFGCTVSGRPAKIRGIETMVGLFINTVPVPVPCRSRHRLDILTAVQDRHASLQPHQFLGLTEIQQDAGVGQLFDTVVVVENFQVPSRTHTGAINVTRVDGENSTHYPLTVVASPDREFKARFLYRSEVFERSAVEAIGARFIRALAAIASDATQR
jgi:non-ribosomal peptide synthetase component F